MSGNTNFRQNLGELRAEWNDLDPTLRFLDIISVILIVIFGIGYILINVLDIILTVSNGAMLIFPLLLSGYIFVLRSKFADENSDNDQAKKEFLFLNSLTIGLILLSFLYSILLNEVLLA